MLISTVQLGRIDYATGLRLQQTLVELRKRDEVPNTLLLLEHTPVITLGRNANRTNVLASDDFLRQRGVELFECDRGGDVTFHGPGQLVGYPIFDLRSFTDEQGNRKTVGAVEFVRRMEEALIRTCLDYKIATERVPGMTGVWTSPTLATSARVANQGKIAAIGVHISRGVTSHGFALNVSGDLTAFDKITPCGISNVTMTSIERETGGMLSVREVALEAERIVRAALATLAEPAIV